ncbi:Uncharacterized protein ACO02O_06588 [Dirofilaria immitis]
MAIIVMGHVGHIDASGMFLGRNGSDFIMQNGGVLPPSLLQENRVPRFYKEAIAKCGAPSQSQLPNTALVYNLMVTSCLPRAILGNIWSLVNRTIPGQLTRQEFFSCLALIALIQKGQPLSALSTMSALPIPHLQACAPFAQHLPGSTAGTQAPIALASNQSFGDMTNLNNQVLPKDINQSLSNAASSILQNSALSDEILNVVPNTSRSDSQTLLSVMIPYSDSSSTIIDADKTTRILEPVECSDIYATITGESKDGEEERLCVWRRCIEEAHTLLSNADSLLLCSAEVYVAEIIRTERGARYINALYEIHEITMRIRKGRSDKLVKQKELLDKIDQIWSRLECFIEENIDSEDTDRFAETVNKTVPSLCGICLTRVPLNSMLEFTGIIYHKQCANLWINRVDSFLPKLKKY